MPKSLDQVNQKEETQEGSADNPSEEKKEGKKFSSQDAEIAIRMGIKLLNEGQGLKVIKDAIDKSQDPGQVIGQFLAQMMGQLAEQLQKNAGVDPGVFVAKGGFLDGILDYIEVKLGYPKDFSDKIYNEVLETVKAAAMNPPAPNNVMQQGGQPQNAAAMPAPAPQPGIPQAGGYS